jgi:NADPH-dependent curcumin reductase CurA
LPSFRQWIVARPPAGDIVEPDLFALRELPVPELAAGQALARVKLINIHANTRLRLARGLVAAGSTDPSNYACAEIVQSRDPAFKEGDLIACQAGWQEFQIVNSRDGPVGHGARSPLVEALNGTCSPWTYVFRPAITRMWPADVLMDVLGSSGMTAYFGLRECGPLTPRDRVAVAGATGSVGAIAAQLARQAGCQVVGFGGGPDRCRRAVEILRIDDCLDYRAADFAHRLDTAFPDGIDVFCDGVGGGLTQAIAGRMNRHGRLFAYGAAAELYADRLGASVPGRPRRAMFGISPAVEALLDERRVKVQAWVVSEFYHERLRAEDDLSRLMRLGELKAVNTVVDGFDNLPAAIAGLYAGRGLGKLQVRFEAAGS